MEVIARRKNSLLVLYGIITLIGIIWLFFACRASLYESEIDKTGEILMGAVISVIGVMICLNVLLTPKIIVCFDGENLILPQGRYAFSELSKVNYRRAHARGIHYNWGKLFLTINGREFSYNNVADVETAHDRLMELRLQIGNE